MKALITGATGFIGSHLAAALISKGFEVTCLVRNQSNLKYLQDINVGLIKGDCTDRESLDNAVMGADFIFHLAGLTKASADEDFFKVNAKGTENIIKAVIKKNPNIKRFVYLSSLAVAGPSYECRPHKEDCNLMPVSVYGMTKLQGEKIVLAHKRDIPVTIIRPPVVYGPRDKDLLVFFKMVKLGIIPYWGKCYYSFIYVDDLINGIILSVLNKDAEGEIFFLSDGNIYSTDNIIEAISEALEKKPLRLKIPKFVMPLLGIISEKTQGVNIINMDKIKEMQHPYWICDITKATQMLGFVPKIKIKEGIKWTADWYRIHKWL